MERLAVPSLIAFLAMAMPAFSGSASPVVRDGDLVFQTSGSGQSTAIMAATGSPFTHMGLVVHRDGRPFVIEAFRKVEVTALDAFIARGDGQRIAVFRDQTLTPDQIDAIVSEAEGYVGAPYDPWFTFDDQSIYCSELAWIAYRAIGRDIGTLQKVSDLDLSSKAVGELIGSRWRSHPHCAELDQSACLRTIVDQVLVTPASIAADPRFKLIYTDW
jgi:hypothetical protein